MYENDELKRVIRKVTLRVVPLMFITYVWNLLDRVNMSNAQTELRESLGLSLQEYATAAGIFFVTYILFEIPSNLILTRVRMNRWFAFLTLCWGLTSMSIAVTKSFAVLLLLRLLFGVFEVVE